MGSITPISSPLGERIRHAREGVGMTQEDLALRIGVNLDTLLSWENGERDPRANRLVTMAGLLNVTPTWLLEGEVHELSEQTVDPLESLRGQLQAARIKVTELADIIADLEDKASQLES